jgi:acetyl-CoA carboxylase beta subunit
MQYTGRKWFDCAECHQETEDHPLLKRNEMVFACKKCKKCFRKDATEFEESDEYCPHCDNHFVIDAITPQPRLEVEGEDVRIDSRYMASDLWLSVHLLMVYRMLKDERVRQDQSRTIFDVKDADNRLG